jgi:hypothetical protein
LTGPTFQAWNWASGYLQLCRNLTSSRNFSGTVSNSNQMQKCVFIRAINVLEQDWRAKPG